MKIAFFVAEDFNLGVAYLMAYLKKKGHNVRLFFDPVQFKRGYARSAILGRIFNIDNCLVRDAVRFNPDLCCFSCVTATYNWGLDLAKKVKKKMPGTKLIFGGVHATLVPEVVRENKFIDEVVVGDGFKYFGGNFEHEIRNNNLYPDRAAFFKVLPPEHRRTQIFMTSFGCPFNCSFCGNEQLRKVNQFNCFRRKPMDCINELQYLKNKTGMKRVLFIDDIFTSDKKWVLEFLTDYSQCINLPFDCFGHVRFLDEEIIKALKDARCKTIWLGIQTGDERLRKQILNRPESNKEIIDTCKLIKKHDLKLMVDHIFGIPTENAMSMDISHNLYYEIKADIINCYELLYFPKAKITEHALAAGVLFPDDIKKINHGQGVNYQLNQKTSDFYRQYAKSFVSTPLNEHPFDLLSMWIIKLIVHIKAGHGFIIRVMLQNEAYFAAKAIRKKLFRFLP